MSAGRKLSPEEEAALIAWYSQYQSALQQLRQLGSIHDKAKEFGIALRTLHTVAKRDDYELRRKCKDAGVTYTPLRVTRVLEEA